jgi:hypothetical protein
MSDGQILIAFVLGCGAVLVAVLAWLSLDSRGRALLVWQPPLPPPPGYGINGGRKYGMTVRDYFAAKAMQALVARYGAEDLNRCAERAFEIADAMLQARAP